MTDENTMLQTFWHKLQILRFTMTHAEMWQGELSLSNKLRLILGGNLDEETLENRHLDASF